jgi:hypothetical protein
VDNLTNCRCARHRKAKETRRNRLQSAFVAQRAQNESARAEANQFAKYRLHGGWRFLRASGFFTPDDI